MNRPLKVWIRVGDWRCLRKDAAITKRTQQKEGRDGTWTNHLIDSNDETYRAAMNAALDVRKFLHERSRPWEEKWNLLKPSDIESWNQGSDEIIAVLHNKADAFVAEYPRLKREALERMRAALGESGEKTATEIDTMIAEAEAGYPNEAYVRSRFYAEKRAAPFSDPGDFRTTLGNTVSDEQNKDRIDRARDWARANARLANAPVVSGGKSRTRKVVNN